jgi:hypothetical protein
VTASGGTGSIPREVTESLPARLVAIPAPFLYRQSGCNGFNDFAGYSGLAAYSFSADCNVNGEPPEL